MSANIIFEHAPIGAIVAWSDATPRPPARHHRKLGAWKTNNSQGRLIRKQGALGTGVVDPHASFTLHEADYGAGDHAELVHLAPHRAAAEQWLSEHGYPNAVLEEVSADEAAADAVEGRAAA